MCGKGCSIATTVIGVLLVVGMSVITFVVVPGVIETLVIRETVLKNDTEQWDRFLVVPFALNFTVRVFNISNPDEVIAGGVPIVKEVGPYTYKLYHSRVPETIEEDEMTYRIHERYEFDPVASYPNTEDDILTIINVPYHAVLQVAESIAPNLMGVLNAGINGILGAELNSPIANFRFGDLAFNGITICQNPGLVGIVACNLIRSIGADAANLAAQDDGSIIFSLFDHKQNKSGNLYKVHRGINDHTQLGIISEWGGASTLPFWSGNQIVENDQNTEEIISVCNMINGTDTGIFPPFVDREKLLYAYNPDICRSVELRYQGETEYEGIPGVRFTANEWFLDNDDGCFCLNATTGITREDGCLLRGAMEIYSCVGAFLVISNPHFLYADSTYRNGVIGLNPNVETHRIVMDIEPRTGTPFRGQKRAQFNIFSRPIPGISGTNALRPTLVPIFWIEEGINLPEEFVNQIKTMLLLPLTIVDIVLPLLIALGGLVVIVGVVLTYRVGRQTAPVYKP